MTLPLTSPIAAQRVPFLSRCAVEDVRQMSSPAKRERKGAHERQRNGIGEGTVHHTLTSSLFTPTSLPKQASSFTAAI